MKENSQKFFKTNKISFSLGFIIIVALSLRMLNLYFALPQISQPSRTSAFAGDAVQYQAIAEAIVTKGIFIPAEGIYGGMMKMSGRELSAKRTPGYPLFLALFYLLFGIKFWPVYLAQSLLDTITVIIVYLMAKEVFGSKKISLIASFLYAINLTAIHFNSRLFTETLFTFMFSLTVLVFLRVYKTDKVIRFVGVGVLLGLSTLIRPIVLYFPAVMIIVLLLKKTSLKRRLSSIAVLMLAFLLTLFPWQYRNLRVFGHYSLTSQAGLNLCYWNARLLKEDIEGLDKRAAREQLLGNSLKGLKNPFEQEKVGRKVALGYICQHPLRYVYLHLKGIKKINRGRIVGSLRKNGALSCSG